MLVPTGQVVQIVQGGLLLLPSWWGKFELPTAFRSEMTMVTVIMGKSLAFVQRLNFWSAKVVILFKLKSQRVTPSFSSLSLTNSRPCLSWEQVSDMGIYLQASHGDGISVTMVTDIPYICPFWFTTILFRPVKSTPESA